MIDYIVGWGYSAIHMNKERRLLVEAVANLGRAQTALVSGDLNEAQVFVRIVEARIRMLRDEQISHQVTGVGDGIVKPENPLDF